MVQVVMLILPETELLDLAGPAQVFDAANGFGAAYALSFVGTAPRVRSAQGLELLVPAALPPITGDDLVLVPGVRRSSPPVGADPHVLAWLRDAADARARIAAVCAGAFTLGEAGLLDGRRCTTHWSLVEALAARFPRAIVEDAALFVQDSGVTTSAGIASGIDMALWLVEQDRGPLMAARVARELVVYLRRDGSHGQSSIYLEYRTHLQPRVHHAQDWLVEHFAT
ncbi:MAG: AraC family transcriptional regulator, partial [Acetobacteraceae bacterium]